MEPNLRLIESMETVFASSQARVVVAYEVLKEKEASGPRYWNKGSSKKARSPRVLCITVKRSKNRGYHGTLFVCKSTPTTRPYYQIRSSWEIGKIVSIDLIRSTEHLPFTIELTVEKETRNYAFYSEDQRQCFAAILFQICRLHENLDPTVSGTTADALVSWWNENSEKIFDILGDFARDLLSTGHKEPVEDTPAKLYSEASVSRQEEEDLNELLDLFVMGPGDVQDFQNRLKDEHRALEDANVHAMLENGRVVDSIMNKLRSASNLLDDLDQNLLVFDMKLRHMKDDIAAIEARNNTLEMEARNSAKLLGTLQDLLGRLELGEGYEKLLENGRFESDRLEGLIQAARSLHATLSEIDPAVGGIPPTLRRMRAVSEHKLKLELLGKGFISRANDYLATTFRQKTDMAMKHTTLITSPHALPKLDGSDAEIRVWREKHAPLLQAMHFLQKASLDALGRNYCSTMNSILRRRVHAFLSRLRSTAKMSLSHGVHEIDISKKPSSEKKISTLEQMVNKAKESVTGSHLSDAESSIQYSHRSKGQENSVVDSGGSPTIGESKMSSGIDMELGSQLHETFQTMLSSVIPTLLEEANAAASFLMLWQEDEMDASHGKQLTEQGSSLIQTLVSGFEDDLFSLVDLTSRGAHLMCLPMLATVLQWIDKIQSDPISWMLIGYLKNIQDRLKKTFDDFMQKKVAEIDRYDAKRSVKANGVKNTHVLPFVSNFAVLVHRIELLLTEVEDDSQLERSFSQSLSHRSAELSDIESIKEENPGVAAAGPVRKEVDLAYMRIVESMFHCIDRLARSDEKHGDRLRLENYSYFDQSVGPLARHVAALSKYCNDAIPLMEESLRKYVQQQLEYGRLWGILDFSNKIETELREVSPQEISFKAGFSAQDLRTLISQTMASPDKKLSMMYTRVKKHLGESSPKLLYTVWQSVEAEVLNRYRKLEQQMMDCYPNIQLSPSPEELAELFKTTGPGT